MRELHKINYLQRKHTHLGASFHCLKETFFGVRVDRDDILKGGIYQRN